MKALLALPVLLMVALAGCGGAPQPVEPDQDAEGRYVIHMNAANRFVPSLAKVPLNATVVWVNDGGVHDVTADDGSWSSAQAYPSKIPVGSSFEHTFTKVGTVAYHCELHRSSGMVAELVVG